MSFSAKRQTAHLWRGVGIHVCIRIVSFEREEEKKARATAPPVEATVAARSEVVFDAALALRATAAE